MRKGRRRQRIDDEDTIERVNVSMSKRLVERIDGYAREKNVSRSFLISEVLAKILNDRVAEERYVESVGPRVERYLSDEDERWIDGKIEQITTNERNPDLQNLHTRDLLEYVRQIDDWYTSSSMQAFIFDSFQRPFPEKVQARIERMVDSAFWFSERREDEKGWSVWYDRVFEHLREVFLSKRRELKPNLRARLFCDVFGVRMLLRYDDSPIPEELMDFLVESVGTLTEEERSEYGLASIVEAVGKRGREDAVRLKQRLLDVYEMKGTDDDVRQYLLRLLEMDHFKGL